MNSVLFILLLAHQTFASVSDFVIADIKVPQKIIYNKKSFQLNGAAIRKVSMFKVKVWVSALYLELNMTDSIELINSKMTKIIDLHALYNVSAKDTVKGWKLAFDENCESKCHVLDPEIQRFYKSVPNFIKGTVYRYIFTKDDVKVLLNNKEFFSSNNLDFSTLLLKTWIGKKPPSEDIKKDLLKGFAV